MLFWDSCVWPSTPFSAPYLKPTLSLMMTYEAIQFEHFHLYTNMRILPECR